MFLCGETKKVNALHFQTETVRVLIMCVTGVCSKEICKKEKKFCALSQRPQNETQTLFSEKWMINS